MVRFLAQTYYNIFPLNFLTCHLAKPMLTFCRCHCNTSHLPPLDSVLIVSTPILHHLFELVDLLVDLPVINARARLRLIPRCHIVQVCFCCLSLRVDFHLLTCMFSLCRNTHYICISQKTDWKHNRLYARGRGGGLLLMKKNCLIII